MRGHNELAKQGNSCVWRIKQMNKDNSNANDAHEPLRGCLFALLSSLVSRIDLRQRSILVCAGNLPLIYKDFPFLDILDMGLVVQAHVRSIPCASCRKYLLKIAMDIVPSLLSLSFRQLHSIYIQQSISPHSQTPRQFNPPSYNVLCPTTITLPHISKRHLPYHHTCLHPFFASSPQKR